MPQHKSKSVLKQFHFVIICFIVLGIGLFALSYSVIDRLITANASAYSKSTAEKFKNEVNFLVKRADTIFTTLLFDNNIESLMLSPFSGKTPNYIRTLQVQFSSYSVMNKDITDIALVSDRFAWSNYYDKASLKKFSKEMDGIYNSHCFGLNPSSLFSITLHEKGAYKLLFGHNIYSMKTGINYGKRLGSAFLSLDLNKSNLVPPKDNNVFTYFILLDDKGNSFPFNGSSEINSKILREIRASGNDTNSELKLFNTNDYLIYTSRIPDTGLTVITALGKHSLTNEVREAAFIIIAVSLVSFAIITLLMRSILRNIVSPLKTLSTHIESLKEISPVSGKIPVKLEGCAEIKLLSDSFNDMMQRQNELSLELQEATVSLYESKLGKKQAELNFLRSQINPHFLYNSLESIASLASEKSVPEIAEAIAALGKLFRYNIKGESIVDLEKELEMIRSYLTICKIRFPEKLNIIYSIRENTLTVPIMKFILQPFVENVLKHIVETGTKTITLYIGARLDKNHLIISIYDDGKGILPEALDKLKKIVSAPLSFNEDEWQGHIGLYNVAKRLFLYYGSDCNIELNSEPENGTKVVINIPIQSEKVEKINVKSSIS